MPTGGADLNIPDTNDDGTPGGENDQSLGEAFNNLMPGDNNWVEAYQRAATGGLFDPETGDGAFVDSDGDFYQDGPAYDGPTNALRQVQSGTVIVGEATGEAAANVASETVDVTADVIQDASGFTWNALGWKGKAAVGLVGAAVLTQVFKPAISAGTTAAEVTQ